MFKASLFIIAKNLKQPRISINRWTDTQTGTHLHSAILFGRKMNNQATKAMNESYMHMAKWKKPEKMNTVYCGLNICLPQFHMLRSKPSNVRILVGGAFGRDLNYEGEASMSGVSLMNKEVSDHAGTQEVCVLEPRLHSIMLDPGSQTSSIPNVRNKFLLFISHLVCRILWQQPEQTKTLIPITRHSGKDRTWATVKGWVIAGSLQGAGRVK